MALLSLTSLAGCSSSSGAAGTGDTGGAGASPGGDTETRDAASGDDATVSPGTSNDAGAIRGERDGGASSASDASQAPAADASTRPRPSSGCASGGSVASATVDLTYATLARTYDLHAPSVGSGPRPLVINMHGYTGSSTQQESITNMNALADTEGFFVAYPQGVGSPTDWNAGACCSAASEGNRDDVGFLNAVIDDVAAKTCVDLARVYAMGFSNGGMMTYRLACQDGARFAATASVSGSAVVALDTCTLAHPMSLFHVHGNADPLVPYDGGAGGLPISGEPTPVFPAVADEVAAFRSKDGCPATSTVYFDDGNAHCDHWGPCQGGSEVVFCTIDQGGHAWPGGTGVFTEASPLEATKEIWTFLSRHTLP